MNHRNAKVSGLRLLTSNDGATKVYVDLEVDRQQVFKLFTLLLKLGIHIQTLRRIMI